MLERAVDTLAAAPVIHLVGYRRAYPVASYLAYALEKMAIPCVLHSAVGHLPTAHALRPGDAVLAITFAPYSAETVAFAEAARAAGHPVVAITDSLSSPLQRSERPAPPRLRGRRRRLPRALGHLRPRHRARGRGRRPARGETPPAADFRVPRTERIFYF